MVARRQTFRIIYDHLFSIEKRIDKKKEKRRGEGRREIYVLSFAKIWKTLFFCRVA